MNSDTPITDAAASPTMFIDGEPVVEIKICRALERKLQKAQAEAALMREAIPFPAITKGNAKAMAWHVSNGEAFAGIDQQALSAWLNSVAAQLQNFVSAALSSNAGRELLEELHRLRGDYAELVNRNAECAKQLEKFNGEDLRLQNEVFELRDELKSTREEVERTKADRNRAGVEERRKYLPKIQELTGELAKANADVLLHSGLRVELTNILGLESLTPRTREGNSALVERVDGLKSELAKAQAQCAELRSEVGKAFREGYCNGYGSDTLGDHGSEDFNLSYNQSRTKKVTEGKL